MSITQTIADLRRAQALLHQRGWCAGEYEGVNGERCAVGALHTALDSSQKNIQRRLERALEALAAALPLPEQAIVRRDAWSRVTSYNDLQKSLDPVSHLFDQAVERLICEQMKRAGRPEGDQDAPSPRCMDLGEEQEQWVGVPEREPMQVPQPQEPERAPLPSEPTPQRQPVTPGVDPRWG